MTTRKTTTTTKPEQTNNDYQVKSLVAALLIHKGTPMKAAIENADWIVESLKNESFRSE
jgi:hypothetical protein